MLATKERKGIDEVGKMVCEKLGILPMAVGPLFKQHISLSLLKALEMMRVEV
jgi:hypothetical protein